MVSLRANMPWLIAIALLGNGCRSTPQRQERAAGTAQDARRAGHLTTAGESTAALADYIDPIPSRRNFLQTELGRRVDGPRSFERTVRREGRIEGSLIGRVEFPLSQYLDPQSRNVDRPRVDWPSAQRGGVDAFFMEFNPAVMEWPLDTVEGDDVLSQARLTAYEGDGVPFAYGTCRRTMRVAARESIRSGEQTFDDAVRMEADTELSFGWLATVRVHETVWFARGVGQVRREERFNGRALWLFRFGGASRYELVDQIAPHVEMVSDEGSGVAKTTETANRPSDLTDGETGIRMWQGDLLSRVAVCFERNGRRVRLWGLAAEYAGGD